jgi:hypothetical protein
MSQLLSILSSGLIGGFIGAFLGGFAKFFWENWLPGEITWRHKQKVDREKFLAQFRDPTMRAASELQERVYALIKFPGNRKIAEMSGEKDYYVASTVFLVAQFFAWMEILRRKAAMLDYGELVRQLDGVVEAFSLTGPSFQIFRLQQREIGERVIVPIPDQQDEYRSLGYAEFIDLMRQDRGSIPSWLSHLEKNIRNMLADRPIDKLLEIQHALIDLMNFLDPGNKWVSKYERKKIRSVRHQV